MIKQQHQQQQQQQPSASIAYAGIVTLKSVVIIDL